MNIATVSSIDAPFVPYLASSTATDGRARVTSAAVRSGPQGKSHALRTSVRPEGRRRETLCGVLVTPLIGKHFSVMHPRACRSCAMITDSTPLRYGISASNELWRLRSLLDDIDEQRVPPADALSWIRTNAP